MIYFNDAPFSNYQLASRIPDHRTVTFADAGHLIPIERPRAFAEALFHFARTLRS